MFSRLHGVVRMSRPTAQGAGDHGNQSVAARRASDLPTNGGGGLPGYVTGILVGLLAPAGHTPR